MQTMASYDEMPAPAPAPATSSAEQLRAQSAPPARQPSRTTYVQVHRNLASPQQRKSRNDGIQISRVARLWLYVSRLGLASDNGVTIEIRHLSSTS